MLIRFFHKLAIYTSANKFYQTGRKGRIFLLGKKNHAIIIITSLGPSDPMLIMGLSGSPHLQAKYWRLLEEAPRKRGLKIIKWKHLPVDLPKTDGVFLELKVASSSSSNNSGSHDK